MTDPAVTSEQRDQERFLQIARADDPRGDAVDARVEVVEAEVDAVRAARHDFAGDGEQVVVAGVMQHIEEAGIHSGDSACTLPPYSLPAEIIAEMERQAEALAMALGVRMPATTSSPWALTRYSP